MIPYAKQFFPSGEPSEVRNVSRSHHEELMNHPEITRILSQNHDFPLPYNSRRPTPKVSPMPHVLVPGTDVNYALIAYDANGVERTDDRDGPMSQQVLGAAVRDSITDVFVMSHGW